MDFDKRPYNRLAELRENWILKNPNQTLHYE